MVERALAIIHISSLEVAVLVVLVVMDQVEDPHGPGGSTGGVGKQLPSTFQDPKSGVGYPGPNGTYW